MAKQKSGKTALLSRKSSFERSLNVSIAGARAGGGVALGHLKRRLGIDSAADSESEVMRRQSRQFVAELGRLKGSYVKIGQLMAQFGEHFLAPELTEALHELGSQTEALEWQDISPQLQAALGHKKLSELEITEQAMAAASLAQVHRAQWRDAPDEQTKHLCLKVLYPGLRESIDSDFDYVVRLLKLGRFLKVNRDLDAWLATLRTQLHQETDYRQERRMTAQVRELAEGLCHTSPELSSGSIRVPRPVGYFSDGDVLALEFMPGLAVNSAQVQGLSQRRRNSLAKTMLELFFAEVFEWGIVQTDPNFGNYLIEPSKRLRGESAQVDALVLLDFGSVQLGPTTFIAHFRDAIRCGLSDDKEGVIAALIGLGCLQQSSDEKAQQSFADFCIAILEPLRPADQLPVEHLNERGQYQWANSRLMKRAGKQAASASLHRQFSLPSVEFSLIARKLIGVFTFISVLRAEFNGHDIAQRYISRSSIEGSRDQHE